MKKIIIGIPSLNSGGVEVSLIRFINELSKNSENVITLLMLKKEGIYLKNVPKNVEIKEVSYIDDMYSYNKRILDIKDVSGLKNKILFLNYRNRLKKYLKNNDWENYYRLILSKTVKIDGVYDLAIDWHGYGHFITTVIADLVTSNKKIMWIHDEKNEWLNKVDYWQESFDKIFCVGQSCLNNIKKHRKDLISKLDIFYNMTDYENVRKKSLEKMDIKYNKDKLNIITVGRLEWQKAYDIAVEIAYQLKIKNIDFCWYVIGGGSKREEIENLIKEKNLEENFKLLGIITNPFPYVKNADMYVLCSRHEGYCLATLEAKILGKVIVATDIDSNREQIKNGKNGFLCKLEPQKFAKQIIKIYNNQRIVKKIEKNLLVENFDYSSEFNKLYDLLK